MSRRITMLSVLGLLAAGIGCNHIGGKNDCGANPADAVIAGPTPPYQAWPATAPTGGPGWVPVPNTGKVTAPAGADKAPEPKKIDEPKKPVDVLPELKKPGTFE